MNNTCPLCGIEYKKTQSPNGRKVWEDCIKCNKTKEELEKSYRNMKNNSAIGAYASKGTCTRCLKTFVYMKLKSEKERKLCHKCVIDSVYDDILD